VSRRRALALKGFDVTLDARTLPTGPQLIRYFLCLTPRQRRAKPPRSQGRKRGSPSLSIHSIVARYVCIPFDEDNPRQGAQLCGSDGFQLSPKGRSRQEYSFCWKAKRTKKEYRSIVSPQPNEERKKWRLLRYTVTSHFEGASAETRYLQNRSTELSKVFPGKKIRGRDHSHVVLPKFCHRRGSSSARSA